MVASPSFWGQGTSLGLLSPSSHWRDEKGLGDSTYPGSSGWMLMPLFVITIVIVVGVSISFQVWMPKQPLGGQDSSEQSPGSLRETQGPYIRVQASSLALQCDLLSFRLWLLHKRGLPLAFLPVPPPPPPPHTLSDRN